MKNLLDKYQKALEVLERISNREVLHGSGYTGCRCGEIAREALEELTKEKDEQNAATTTPTAFISARD